MTKGVFRDVIIEYEGETYVVTPSNRLLRQIDAELAPQSLFGILSNVSRTNLPLPSIALIVQQLLNSAGGQFTEDDILAGLLHDVSHNNGDGVRPLLDSIASCLAVEGIDAKNSSPPLKKSGGTKAPSGQKKAKTKINR